MSTLWSERWVIEEHGGSLLVRRSPEEGGWTTVVRMPAGLAGRLVADYAARPVLEARIAGLEDENARLKALAELARSRAVRLNRGDDDRALRGEILERLGEILGPLPEPATPGAPPAVSG